jgi:RNA polymerase sigma-70 factor (ECF subfamily)
MDILGFGALLRRARAGCKAALGALFQPYYEPLLHYARDHVPARIRPKVGGSDLVQQTYCKAQKNLTQFAGNSEKEWIGWLYSILKNEICDAYRSYTQVAKRDVAREQKLARVGERLIAAIEAPETEAEACEQLHTLEARLEELGASSRRALELRIRHGCTYSQIGDELGCSEDAAWKIYQRGVAELWKVITDHVRSAQATPT